VLDTQPLRSGLALAVFELAFERVNGTYFLMTVHKITRRLLTAEADIAIAFLA